MAKTILPRQVASIIILSFLGKWHKSTWRGNRADSWSCRGKSQSHWKACLLAAQSGLWHLFVHVSSWTCLQAQDDESALTASWSGTGHPNWLRPSLSLHKKAQDLKNKMERLSQYFLQIFIYLWDSFQDCPWKWQVSNTSNQKLVHLHIQTKTK